jgi:predicted MFS family arabinose efflux permease
MLPLRIVLDRNRGGSYLAFFLATLAMFAMFLFLTYYLQGVLGYSALKAGVAFLWFPMGVIISSTIASKTLPRFGPRALATVGFALATLGMLWLTQLEADSSYFTHVVPSMLLICLGMGQVFVPLSSTALLGVPNHDAGAASALVNTMQQIGGSLGVAFLNTIATSATVDFAATHGGPSRRRPSTASPQRSPSVPACWRPRSWWWQCSFAATAASQPTSRRTCPGS